MKPTCASVAQDTWPIPDMQGPKPDVDPFDSPEYQAFVESMVQFCHCSRNRPCDGVLAGGLCDNIQDDPFDDDCEDDCHED